MDDTAYLVIREHCLKSGTIGSVVWVDAVEPPHPVMYLRCTACGGEYAHDSAHALLRGKQQYHPFGWLKPMPPINETVETREVIEA